ncbi:hypothetical protein Enr13x_57350 [Stieleria neptunia]|uniref:Uncharacterized protein n=1 Tax=Stieleria neptunia TaxID=2527979 RepID=A0A518HYA4_9BACT|nr:hypothetical protein Enr13x_57350 [Stieleria neptunia]
MQTSSGSAMPFFRCAFLNFSHSAEGEVGRGKFNRDTHCSVRIRNAAVIMNAKPCHAGVEPEQEVGVKSTPAGNSRVQDPVFAYYAYALLHRVRRVRALRRLHRDLERSDTRGVHVALATAGRFNFQLSEVPAARLKSRPSFSTTVSQPSGLIPSRAKIGARSSGIEPRLPFLI